MKIIIQNGKIIDGSGTPAFAGEVVIEGERIVKLLHGKKADTSGAELVIDAHGKWVIPGLIDMHSHADVTCLHIRPWKIIWYRESQH